MDLYISLSLSASEPGCPHLGSYLVVDFLFLSIIYYADKDELIVIHSDESLDLSRSDYLDNELSSLVSE